MSRRMLGVDASYDRLTDRTAEALVRDGVEVFVQCLWTGVERPPYAVQNLINARDAGLVTAAYGSLSGAGSGEYHARMTRGTVSDAVWDALALCFIDDELPNVPDRDLRTAVDFVAAWGKPRAVYTSRGHWGDVRRDTAAFRDCLLWDASWLAHGAPAPDEPLLGVPYGGWTEAQTVGRQWKAGEVVDGLYCDRSYFARGLLMDAPTKAEFGALYALVAGETGILPAVRAIGAALAQHIQEGTPAPAADLAALKAHVDALDARVAQAAKALVGQP
ncbi:MAG TPA: hypothetical protein VFC53_01570 [Dehalococcoidia bacterium]|nr:hypothetical protein [Dehalococcoidia bacterium]